VAVRGGSCNGFTRLIHGFTLEESWWVL